MWGAEQVLVSFFFSSRRRHTRLQGDWSSDVCSSDLPKTSRQMLWNRRCVTDRERQEQRRIGGCGQRAGCHHPPCSRSRQGPCRAHLELSGTSSPPCRPKQKSPKHFCSGDFFIWGG